MIDPVEIINRFTEYSPSKGETPLPLPIPGYWFRKICALADRIADAENTLEAYKIQYQNMVTVYTADHGKVETLTAELASETRWANEYHQEADKAEAELQQVRALCAELLTQLDDWGGSRNSHEAGVRNRARAALSKQPE
jgi:uncharacterized protein involved in exopolysaccharide biosynthesis